MLENAAAADHPREAFTREPARRRGKIGGKRALLCVALAAAWLIVPSPYNFQYCVKWTFLAPTGVCGDGVYMFAKGGYGECDHHGGVKRWMAR